MRSYLADLLCKGALASVILLTACVPATPMATPSALPVMPSPTVTPMPEPTQAIPTPVATMVTPTVTLAPSPTIPRITPSPAAKETSSVRAYQGSTQLLLYPYESFGRDVLDRTYNITFRQFDALAFGGATRVPSPKTYKTLVLENDYLRLTFLPDLGGRLWQVLYKPTGQTLFYNNRVLKPTPWGPSQQGGWLAVGGMEWALPVDEHGYEWGRPWRYRIDGGTVTLWDTEATDRVRARISVTLPPNAAYFIIHPRVENPTRAPISLQFWINAQLALNDGLKDKRISPATEFLLPGDQVWIHSTANAFIPEASIPPVDSAAPVAPVNWHQVGGRDLAQYKNWDDYLGFFLTRPTANFVGVYNPANHLGVARIFPPDRVPGVKVFAWGPRFAERALYTDDDSEYMELWGGLPRTFFRVDNVALAAGEIREWDEYWVPFAGTGGLTAATRSAILHLANDGRRVAIDVAATARGTRGTLTLSQEKVELKRWNVSLDPGTVFHQQVDAPRSGSFALRFTAQDGTLLGEAFSN